MRGSHLRLVAEQAESEAAAFELHLQGGAPRHGDPAPVVSSEHAGGWARLPTLCTPPAPGSALSPRLQSREPARQSAGRAGKLTPRSSQTPPPETTPGPGRARRTPCPPPPKARPAGPVLGRQAVSPPRHPTPREHCGSALFLPAPGPLPGHGVGPEKPRPTNRLHLARQTPGAR